MRRQAPRWRTRSRSRSGTAARTKGPSPLRARARAGWSSTWWTPRLGPFCNRSGSALDDLLDRLGQLHVPRRQPAGVVRRERDLDAAPDVEPLGGVVLALGEQRDPGHETPRLVEVGELVLLDDGRASVDPRPAREPGERGGDLGVGQPGDAHRRAPVRGSARQVYCGRRPLRVARHDARSDRLSGAEFFTHRATRLGVFQGAVRGRPDWRGCGPREEWWP